MEYSFIALLVVSGISLLLPKWLLLICCIPILMVVSFNNILPPLVSIGDADIHIYDPVLIVVIVRVLGPILLRKQRLYFYPQYLSIAIFLYVLLAATILSYYRFGEEVFISEIISYLRLLTQIAVFFLLPYSIRTKGEFLLARKSFYYVGYAIALTVYLSLIFFRIGMILGEVQTSEGINRYFGFLGDQIGFIILFFIFNKLIDRDWIGALFFAGALLATGTRGAFIALVMGTVVLLRIRNELPLSKKKVAILLLVLGMFASVMVLQDFGGSRSRFVGHHLEAGLTQRLLTMKLAGLMFIDNIIIGVGYTGFRHLALDYGAMNEFGRLGYYFSENFIATAGNQFFQVATDGGILGLISFGYLVIVLLRTLKKAAMNTVNENRNMFFAGYVWLLSLLIGNLTAAWLLPSSMISYLLWIVLGFSLLSDKLFPIPNRYSVVLGLNSKMVRT